MASWVIVHIRVCDLWFVTCIAIGGESCSVASCSSVALPMLTCCSSTHVCADYTTTYCGVGDSCTASTQCDQSTMYCTGGNTCATLIANGGTCSVSSSCASGLCCSSTCATLCSVGQSCTLGTQCVTGYCKTATSLVRLCDLYMVYDALWHMTSVNRWYNHHKCMSIKAKQYGMYRWHWMFIWLLWHHRIRVSR